MPVVIHNDKWEDTIAALANNTSNLGWTAPNGTIIRAVFLDGPDAISEVPRGAYIVQWLPLTGAPETPELTALPRITYMFPSRYWANKWVENEQERAK